MVGFRPSDGALLSSLLVPALIGHVNNDDPESVARVVGGFLGRIVVGFSVIVAVAVLVLRPIVELFAMPIADQTIRRQFVVTGGPLLVFGATFGAGVELTQVTSLLGTACCPNVRPLCHATRDG